MQTIGDMIKKQRKKKKLTQQELADNLNMSRSYIADLENGRYVPSYKTLLHISEELDIDLNNLKEGR